jgi:hypothetical protein
MSLQLWAVTSEDGEVQQVILKLEGWITIYWSESKLQLL